MTLVYRALWQDDEGQLIDTVRNQFLAWTRDKYPALQINATDGRTLYETNTDSIEIVIERGTGQFEPGNTMDVLRTSLIETRNQGGSRWETKIRCWKSAPDVEPMSGAFGAYAWALPVLLCVDPLECLLLGGWRRGESKAHDPDAMSPGGEIITPLCDSPAGLAFL